MEGKVISLNRSASHDYFILERYEAGIVLDGGEVKSLRAGRANLKDSFCTVQNGELFVKNMHIATYERAGAFNVKNSKRDRKLLLKKTEISRLIGKITQKGLTLIPLKLYFKSALIKVELGLCQGKHLYDKKRVLKDKDIARDTERQLKNLKK